MSRDLKFRAYIEDEGHFIFCEDSEEDFLGTFFTVVRQIEEMSGKKIPKDLFMGLTDKNGVEIYKGDILLLVRKRHQGSRFTESESSYRAVVDFFDAAFRLKTLPPTPEWQTILSPTFEASQEVIGNIYENPDLLKPTPL